MPREVNLRKFCSNKGEPVFAGTIGDPNGIEVVVAGIPPEDWHIVGIRGFGFGFMGDNGCLLSGEAVDALNEVANNA